MEPTTRPSDYHKLLEDTPEGNKAFKVYMIDSLVTMKSDIAELKKAEPSVTMTVNEVREFKDNYRFLKKAITGIMFVGAAVFAVWEGGLKLIDWIKHS